MGVEVYPYSVPTLAIDSVSGQRHARATLPLGSASELILRGDETGYFRHVSNLQTENRRMNLYCKMNFLNVTDDLILSLGTKILLATKLLHFLYTQFNV